MIQKLYKDGIRYFQIVLSLHKIIFQVSEYQYSGIL